MITTKNRNTYLCVLVKTFTELIFHFQSFLSFFLSLLFLDSHDMFSSIYSNLDSHSFIHSFFNCCVKTFFLFILDKLHNFHKEFFLKPFIMKILFDSFTRSFFAAAAARCCLLISFFFLSC